MTSIPAGIQMILNRIRRGLAGRAEADALEEYFNELYDEIQKWHEYHNKVLMLIKDD